MAEKNDDDLLSDAIPIDEQDDEDEVIELVDDDDEAIDLEAEDASAKPAKPAAKAKPTQGAEPDSIELSDEDPDHPMEIRTFEAARRQKKDWKRQPNKDGTGATHVKTFVAKLRMDAIENLDDQVNEWLDDHPEVEVKYVTTVVGVLKGKVNEDALFMNVWV